MTKDQTDILKNDLEYVLDKLEKVDENTNLQELILDLQVICHRDLRILNSAKPCKFYQNQEILTF